MAPARSESSLFLKAPNTFKLQFLEGSAREHKFLPKIKEPVRTHINSCAVKCSYIPQLTRPNFVTVCQKRGLMSHNKKEA